jgi:hypothetical protein
MTKSFVDKIFTLDWKIGDSSHFFFETQKLANTFLFVWNH